VGGSGRIAGIIVTVVVVVVAGFDTELIYPNGLSCTMPTPSGGWVGGSGRIAGMIVTVVVVVAGFDSELIYPNGLSCTMPPEFQQRIINTIPGLEKAHIVKPGMHGPFS